MDEVRSSAGEDDAFGDVGAGDGESVVGGLGTAGFAFGERLDAEFGAKLFDRLPGSLDPAAVLVGPVAPLLPLRPRREELRVVRHVEFGGVLDAPAASGLVAQQHAVGVDLRQHFQVAPRLDFQNRPAVGRELHDLLAGVIGGELLARLPIGQTATHEGRADRLGLPALRDDDRVELERAVNVEDPFAVLEAEQPFPTAVIEEQPAQVAGAVSRCRGPTGRSKPRRPSGRSQQRVGLFQEELVEVDVGRALMAEAVLGIGIAGRFLALLLPAVVAALAEWRSCCGRDRRD